MLYANRKAFVTVKSCGTDQGQTISIVSVHPSQKSHMYFLFLSSCLWGKKKECEKMQCKSW